MKRNTSLKRFLCMLMVFMLGFAQPISTIASTASESTSKSSESTDSVEENTESTENML